MPSPVIYIIEDEKPIADLLAYGLEQQGYEARTAYTGGDGIRLFEQGKPDLLILDWMLPDCSGIDLCHMITERYNIPLIMLTARSHTDDKVQGLEAGADDYITKPFELREVLARIRVILRRVHRAAPTQESGRSEPYTLAQGLLLYTEERLVEREGKEIDLTPKEYELLLYLFRHPHQVFTREALLEQIWGYEYAGDTRTVDTHVQRLRKKLGCASLIQTVFGVGYKFGG